MTKQYYDKSKDVTIIVTAGKKRTKAQKKRYFQNRKSQLGQRQRELMADMTWIQSFSKKDPNLMPIDQRDLYFRAQQQQVELQKQLLGITGMIQALNRNDKKEFTEIATQADLILPNDIVNLLEERTIIGEQIFDKASIKGTRLERLRKMANDRKDLFINMFKSNTEDNPNYYTLNNNFKGIVQGRNITNIDRLYEAVLERKSQLGIESLTYLRDFEPGYGPYEGVTTEQIEQLEQVTTPAGALATQPEVKPGEEVTAGSSGAVVGQIMIDPETPVSVGTGVGEAGSSIDPVTPVTPPAVPRARRTASGRLIQLFSSQQGS